MMMTSRAPHCHGFFFLKLLEPKWWQWAHRLGFFFPQTCRVEGQDDNEFNSLSSLFFIFQSYRGEGHDDEKLGSSFSLFFVIVYSFKTMTMTSWTCHCPSFFFPNLQSWGPNDEECDAFHHLYFLCSRVVEVRAKTTKNTTLCCQFFLVIIYGSRTTMMMG